MNLSNSLQLLALRLRTRIVVLLGAMAFCVASAAAQRELTIPPPSGMLNDFAKVVGSDRAAQIEILAQFVRAKSGGEIAIVTLSDISGREVGDVALGIGRDWKVGAKAAVGDARRNTGIVVLLVPKETSSDGRGYISIQAGNGVEGFIPDAVAGDIRREATPLLQRRDYGGALYLITARLAERYAAEFGFSLDSAGAPMPSRGRRARAQQPDGGGGISPFVALMVFVVTMMLLSGGRRSGCLGFLLGQAVGQAMGGGGRWGGGGGFGGGGGGGGGFGGFGGGGGFSGGGSSGSY